MNVCSIWPFAQISDDFNYLGIWQCARYAACSIIQAVSFNYHQRNVRSRVSAVMTVTVSKFEPGLGLGGYGLDYITALFCLSKPSVS